MRFNHFRRREFIALLGGAAVSWPLDARVQQDRVRRIGVFIGIARDAEGQARVAAFREALQAPGWTAGRNVQFDERWATGDPQLMQPYAKELLALKPDAIRVATNPALAALRQETRTVPSWPSYLRTIADVSQIRRDSGPEWKRVSGARAAY